MNKLNQKKLRVLYVLANYPQLSQTYIKNEIEAVLPYCDIEIVTLIGADSKTLKGKPYTGYKNHQPYSIERNFKRIVEKIKDFSPDVLHSHWINMAPLMTRLSSKTGIPYTIRAHSFDVLNQGGAQNHLIHLYNWFQNLPQFRGFKPDHVAKQINSKHCLGILSFPFTRPILESAGINPRKITECFPVVAYQKFLDRSKNGNRIMNIGACIPKKRMEDFIDLAKRLPELDFDLYSIGYQTQKIIDYNEKYDNPVNIISTLEPEVMPSEYKKHKWLVYTADRAFNTVGWPMAVAEAQASGVGVCLPNIRSDLKEYIGEAGYLYNSIQEVEKIISGDVPNEILERGFEQASKSDITVHVKLLMNLWTDRT